MHPGLCNQYKLVFTLFIIGCLDVSDTQWLRSLVEGSIEAAHFYQVSMDFLKFHFKRGYGRSGRSGRYGAFMAH